MSNEKIKEELEEVIAYLNTVLTSKTRKLKLAGIQCAYYTMRNIISDNIVYNNIKDYYKNLTLGNCNVTKKYINYLIELVKIELDKID